MPKLIKSYQKFLNGILVVLDIFVAIISFAFAWLIRFRTELFHVEGWHISFTLFILPAIAIIPINLIFYQLFGLYKSQRNSSFAKEIESIVKANIIIGLIFFTLLFMLKQMDYSRIALTIYSVLNVAFGIIERLSIRFLLRRLRENGYNLKNIIIIGTGQTARSFVEKISAHKYLGYHIVGYLDDIEETEKLKYTPSVLGKISDLEKYANTDMLDEVVIAIELSQYERLGEVIEVCEKCGVKAQIIPDYFRYIPAKPYIDQIEELQLINIRYVPLDDSLNKFIKRVTDVLMSASALIILTPLLLIVAILVKITSEGPVLYKQNRVGLGKKEFEMYKFRSMRVQNQVEEQTIWTTKHDARKTKIGEFIRKTSIDELPQLFNVLKGDMSMIGPRPERPYFVEQFKDAIPKYMVKHHVRPGITGWAQVNGYRGDTSIIRRIEHDIYYIENWTLWLDIRIIFLTILKGFVNKNAY